MNFTHKFNHQRRYGVVIPPDLVGLRYVSSENDNRIFKDLGNRLRNKDVHDEKDPYFNGKYQINNGLDCNSVSNGTQNTTVRSKSDIRVDSSYKNKFPGANSSRLSCPHRNDLGDEIIGTSLRKWDVYDLNDNTCDACDIEFAESLSDTTVKRRTVSNRSSDHDSESSNFNKGRLSCPHSDFITELKSGNGLKKWDGYINDLNEDASSEDCDSESAESFVYVPNNTVKRRPLSNRSSLDVISENPNRRSWRSYSTETTEFWNDHDPPRSKSFDNENAWSSFPNHLDDDGKSTPFDGCLSSIRDFEKPWASPTSPTFPESLDRFMKESESSENTDSDFIDSSLGSSLSSEVKFGEEAVNSNVRYKRYRPSQCRFVYDDQIKTRVSRKPDKKHKKYCPNLSRFIEKSQVEEKECIYNSVDDIECKMDKIRISDGILMKKFVDIGRVIQKLRCQVADVSRLGNEPLSPPSPRTRCYTDNCDGDKDNKNDFDVNGMPKFRGRVVSAINFPNKDWTDNDVD